MIEICSLDFLNKESFETDIMTVDGRLLCQKNDAVTPELLLRLYFKKTYIKEPIVKAVATASEVAEENIVKQLESLQSDLMLEPALDKEVVEEIVEDVVVMQEDIEDLDEPLEFDEEEAKRVSLYSLVIGKALNFSAKKLKELEQASYYHNIGRTKFTKADLTSNDFAKNQANAGYDIILNEKKLSQKIAEAAKLYHSSYISSEFKLSEEVPYYQIVSVASFYDKMTTNNHTKEETLDKMLQLGGNKFNIFVLHKFINNMRKSNG